MVKVLVEAEDTKATLADGRSIVEASVKAVVTTVTSA
jgi:hypothetical protein